MTNAIAILALLLGVWNMVSGVRARIRAERQNKYPWQQGKWWHHL